MPERRININGIETRRQIDEMAGKKNGVTKISKQLGLAKETVNQICRKGYGAPETINRCMKAGLPIVISTKAIPCRVKKEHLRYDTRRAPRTKMQRTRTPELPIRTPENQNKGKQISIEDLAIAEQVKELMISHLTALIEDLKKI